MLRKTFIALAAASFLLGTIPLLAQPPQDQRGTQMQTRPQREGGERLGTGTMRGQRRIAPGQERPGVGIVTEEDIKSVALAKDESEKKILDVLADMDKNQRRGNMNVPTDDGRLLRMLTETTNAKNVIEIGTSNGYSGIWFAMALRKTEGKLTTYEIDEGRAKLARENFKRADVEKYITLVMGDAHENVLKLDDTPIDIIFLDADKDGYIDYLEKLFPKIRPGGLIIAHNMNTRQADPKFLKAIKEDKRLDTLFVYTEGSGVAVMLKKR